MKAIALMYHDVALEGSEDASGFPGGDAARYKLTPERFDEHLRAIRAVRRAAEAVDRADCGQMPPPLLLTFDDGGASAMRIADRLDSFGWRGHFFMTGAYVDHPGFLSRGELRDLRGRGHVIGSHSYSHPLRMARVPFERLHDEWTRSAASLADILGEAVVTASVPGGDHSRAVVRAAADAGIGFLFTSAPTVRIRRVDDLWVIGRYVVHRSTDAACVASVAAGSAVRRVRQFAWWEMKKAAKAVAGGAYLLVRERLLGRSEHVRWGDELADDWQKALYHAGHGSQRRTR